MSKQKEYDFLLPESLDKEAVGPIKTRRPSFLVEDIIQDKPRTQAADSAAHITRLCFSNTEGGYDISTGLLAGKEVGKVVAKTKG